MIPSFFDMLTNVFPWMIHILPDANNHRVCRLGHSNASPQNNKCGPDQTPWDLPPHPDDETRAWIAKYNQIDLQVYQAAVKLVKLEKRALGIEWNEHGMVRYGRYTSGIVEYGLEYFSLGNNKYNM